MAFAPQKEHLFTLEGDNESQEIALSAYKELDGSLSIWVKVGLSLTRIDGIEEAIDVIDIITEALDKIGEMDEFRI